jgi:hypothetical protein
MKCNLSQSSFPFLYPHSFILIIVQQESSYLSHILVSLLNFGGSRDYCAPAVAHKHFIINLINEYLLFLINGSRQEAQKGA